MGIGIIQSHQKLEMFDYVILLQTLSCFMCYLFSCTVALCEIRLNPLKADVYKDYKLIHYLALKSTQIHRCPPYGVSGQIVDFYFCS